MKILIVNTIYYPQGGAPIYGLKLAELLQKKGHTPIPFSMQNPKNIETPYEKYFVSPIDFRKKLRRITPKKALDVVGRIFHFSEAKQKMEQLLDDEQIDIVHLNNFLHHISLSIIEPIVRRNIPLVWTLHDSILVCPNTNLFDDKRSEPCSKCTNSFKRIVLPVLKRCKKGSFLASSLASAEALYISLKRVQKIPKYFISPSEFLKEQHSKMSFDTSRFVVVPNFVDCAEFEPHPEPGDYALYFGRLSQEKGLEFLIKAFAKLKDKKLVIVGTGAQENELKKLARALNAPVEFVGFRRGEELRKSIYNSRFVIVPSVCYENAPLAILESFASGKPVLASDIGGMPELVTGDVGRLFPPKDADAIAETVEKLWDDDIKISIMGRSARKIAEEKYSIEVHLEKIMEIYNDAIEK